MGFLYDTWGGSWGSSWAETWGAPVDVEVPAGGAGGGGHRARGGRQFPFPNKYDDPQWFDPPPKLPDPEDVETYVEGDPAPVEDVKADVGHQIPPLPFVVRRPKPPEPTPEDATRQRVEKVAKAAKAKARKTPKYKPPPEREPIPDPVPEPRQMLEIPLPPLTEAEEKEEELLVLRMLEVL